MIESGGGNVNILYADGTSAAFDPEELRQRLENSFSASGRMEVWIADEIVLAVEYALRNREEAGNDLAGPVVHAADIDECVIRVLEDAGFPETAKHFRENPVTSGDFGKLSPDRVEQYLAEKLQLTGLAGSALAEKIRNAMAAIGAAQCSPHLILELARHFRDSAASAHRLPPPPAAKPGPAAAPVSAPAEKLLQIRRTDRIFPSIRAEIDLGRLLEKCTLIPPLTELSLIPILQPVAGRLDAECRKLRCGGAEKYPLVLTLRGFSDFAAKWLCYESNVSRETLKRRGRAFASCFCALMSEKPFKTLVR